MKTPAATALATLALGLSLLPATEFETEVRNLFESYQKSFSHPAAGLFYHHRLDGPKGVAALSSPEEIARGEVNGKSMPYGYGS